MDIMNWKQVMSCDKTFTKAEGFVGIMAKYRSAHYPVHDGAYPNMQPAH